MPSPSGSRSSESPSAPSNTDGSPANTKIASSPTIQFKLLNPFLNSIFSINDPSKSYLKDIYSDLQQNPFAYAFIVPDTYTLLNYFHVATGTSLKDHCFRPEFLRDHILDLRNQNLHISKNTNLAALLNTKKSKHFKNCNNKDLLLKKDQILINNEFFNGQQQEGSDFLKFKVNKIELFLNFNSYFPPGHEFLLIHIDRPLIGSLISEIKFHQIQTLPNLRSYGQQQNLLTPTHSRAPSAHINTPGSVNSRGFNRTSFDQINIEEELVLPKTSFTQLTGRFSLINQKLAGEFQHLFTNFVIESINDPMEIVMLYRETINQSALIFKSLNEDIISSILSYDPTIDLNRCIYDYVELNLYDKVWSQLRLTLLEKIEDEETQYLTQEIYNKLQHLSITQVGIFEDFAFTTKREKLQAQLLILLTKINNSVKIFSKIALTNNYFDKLKLFLQSITELTKPSDDTDSMDVNADMLVALMILVVIQSKVPDIHVHLEYIKNFSYFSYISEGDFYGRQNYIDINSGFIGYCISTLDGVLYHLQNKTNLKTLMNNSMKNFELWDIVNNKLSSAVPKLIDFIESETRGQNSEDFLPLEHPLRSINFNGNSCLMMSLQSNPEIFKILINYNEFFFPIEDLLNDYDVDHNTLLHQAVIWEKHEVIDCLLEILRSSCTVKEIIKYVNHKDKTYGRSVGHYLSRYDRLIDKIGLFVDWKDTDIAGNTPLMSVCRNYDVADYNELLAKAFDMACYWYKVQGKDFNYMDHIDNKGNTLLHMIKEGNLDLILKQNVDVNIFNDRGYCPLVVYIRYDRPENIRSIIKDDRLNIFKVDSKTFLTILDYVKMSPSASANSTPITELPIEDNNEMIEKLIDGFYLSNYIPTINGRQFGVLRAKLDSNQWYFIMKGSIIERKINDDEISVTRDPNIQKIRKNDKLVIHRYTNYHSINEFRSLIQLLHIEYPVSYLPIAFLMDSIFSRLNMSTFTFFNFNKLKINEMMLKLNIFLIGLELSRDFYNHELIWEFLILPPEASNQKNYNKDIGFNGSLKSNLEARSRLKLESNKEKLVYGNNKNSSNSSTPKIEESPVSASPNIPEEFTDAGSENLKELFEIDEIRNYSIKEVEDIWNFFNYSMTELDEFLKTFQKFLQLKVVGKHKVDNLDDSFDNFAKFIEEHLIFESFNGYYDYQLENINNDNCTSYNDSKNQYFLPLAKILKKSISEMSSTPFNSQTKFIFFLQFLKSCGNRLIRNINSVLNKKIIKWLKLAKEIQSLKEEIKKIRPDDFRTPSSILEDPNSPLPITPLASSKTFNPFSKVSGSPKFNKVNSHTRSTSVSSIETVTGEEEEEKEEVNPLLEPPLPTTKKDDDLSETSSANDTLLPLINTPQKKTPIKIPFSQESSDTNSITSSTSTASSSLLLPKLITSAVTPSPKKKKSFLSNILESRKTNYEMKIIKQYKINRLKLMGLSNDVKFVHESLATEISNFMEFKELFLKYSIKVFVKDEIQRLKYSYNAISLGLDQLK